MLSASITEQTIHRQGTTWIGALEQNSSNVSVVLSTTCPFNYCYRSDKKIKSSNHPILLMRTFSALVIVQECCVGAVERISH